jgi:hypothetical protein
MSSDGIQRRGDRPRKGDVGYVDERDSTGRRGYKWPSFTKGNEMSVVRHGVHSPRIVSGLAGELAEWLVSEYPDLAEPRYRFSVAAWARAETIAALLTHYLDQVDVVDDGEPRQKLLEQLRAASRHASEERAKLGLSPIDHARLEKQRAEAVAGAVDLGELMRRGDAALAAGQERSEAGRLRDGGEDR